MSLGDFPYFFPHQVFAPSSQSAGVKKQSAKAIKAKKSQRFFLHGILVN